MKVSVQASLDPTDASVSDGTTVRMRAYKNELESSPDKRGASFRVCVQARYAGGEEGDKHPESWLGKCITKNQHRRCAPRNQCGQVQDGGSIRESFLRATCASSKTRT